MCLFKIVSIVNFMIFTEMIIYYLRQVTLVLFWNFYRVDDDWSSNNMMNVCPLNNILMSFHGKKRTLTFEHYCYRQSS